MSLRGGDGVPTAPLPPVPALAHAAAPTAWRGAAVLAWSTRWRMPPPGGGSSSASAAEMVSVTRARRCGRPRARRRSACRCLVSMTMPSKMCSRAVSCTRRTVPTWTPSRRAHGRPARQHLVGDRVAVVVCHGPPGCHASVAWINDEHGPGHRRHGRPRPGAGHAPRGRGPRRPRPRPQRGARARALGELLDGRATCGSSSRDLASLEEVARLAEPVERDRALDVLVNNAGIGSTLPGDGRRMESGDGHELRFAVNYLAGYFLLTRRLLRRCCGRPRRPGSSTWAPPARRRSTSTT